MKLSDIVLLEDDNLITEDAVFEMARIQPANTGLPYIMFASTKDYVEGKHWARIKVSNIPGTFSKDDNFSVSISRTPEVLAGKPTYGESKLADIFDWVALNYEPLMKYWNNEYEDDADFYAELQRV